MPAWSTDIANELIKVASQERKAFNQMQLQELVYIAHGWCLAISGQPLTGDRPEAVEYGPEYRRLANALAPYGVAPVTAEIEHPTSKGIASELDATLTSDSVLSEIERRILRRIYAVYGDLDIRHLATVTRARGTPWHAVYAGGVGKNRDISHNLIKAQFEDVAAKFLT